LRLKHGVEQEQRLDLPRQAWKLDRLGVIIVTTGLDCPTAVAAITCAVAGM
jgi:hypothetical protein